MMLDIEKMTAFAVAAALCAVVVRNQSREIAMVIAVAAVAAILSYCLQLAGSIKHMIEILMEAAQLSPVTTMPLMKTVGVAILTHLGAEVCRDTGEGGLAAAVEIAGGVAALYLAVPLLQVVLDMILALF